jgi:hypothetical protein
MTTGHSDLGLFEMKVRRRVTNVNADTDRIVMTVELESANFYMTHNKMSSLSHPAK